MKEIWVLIDCNNFFVSCERVFRPDLQKQPVLVLSSNDGCTVSRSSEVKRIGVQMGAPKFQIEDLIKKHQIHCFSSNFGLYADMSTRVMRTIREVSGVENQEVYSIDECFVRGHSLGVKNWLSWGKSLKKKIEKEVGIPVTVGIAGTKTLAKLAVEVAKKDLLGEGVAFWNPEQKDWEETCVNQIKVNEVWGIGGATARKLFRQKINTVGEFKQKQRQWVRDEFGLGGEKTWRELKGESCIEHLESQVNHKTILRSRSFGEGVKEKAELQRAVAEYMTIAGENLRRHQLRAGLVTVFVRTGYYNEKEQKYGSSKTISLDQSTSYLPDLMMAAMQVLDQIFVKGFVYKKAGVILSGLESENAWQPALPMREQQLKPSGMANSAGEEGQDLSLTEEKKQIMMRTIDRLNRKYGQRKINVGMICDSNNDLGQAVVAKWRSKATLRSAEYTTKWEELKVVN